MEGFAKTVTNGSYIIVLKFLFNDLRMQQLLIKMSSFSSRHIDFKVQKSNPFTIALVFVHILINYYTYVCGTSYVATTVCDKTFEGENLINYAVFADFCECKCFTIENFPAS